MKDKIKVINGNTLKLIAVITMIIDHIGAVILSRMLISVNAAAQYDRLSLFYQIARNIGRTAFPLYCFLLVEGFLHTRAKGRYAVRLLIFAALSEIPFDLALFGKVTFAGQNVLFSLLIGLLMMWGMQIAEEKLVTPLSVRNKYYGMIGRGIGWGAIILLYSSLAVLLAVDYGYHGIVLIAIFYILRHSRGVSALVGYLSFSWEAYCLPAFILMLFYNGKRGKRFKGGGKYIFYLIYPVHLLLLYLIWLFLLR